MSIPFPMSRSFNRPHPHARFRTATLLAALPALLLPGVPGDVAAQDSYTWTGAAGTFSWQDSLNWTSPTAPAGTVPDLGDTVNFNVDATVTNGGAATTFLNTAQILLPNGNSLRFGGVAGLGSNVNAITVGDGTNSSQAIFYVENELTLSGGGDLVLADSNDSLIAGWTGADTLINDTGHTIRGVGDISLNAMTNRGTLVAEGGTLDLNNTAVNNTGGTIRINADSRLLTPGMITGGTLEVTAGGRIEGNGLIDGVALADNLPLSNGSSLRFRGDITNANVITVGNGVGSADAYFYVQDELTLSGGGELVLADRFDAFVLGWTGGDTLVNGVDHTIRGTGTIQVQTLDNDGTLWADGGFLDVDNTTIDNADGVVLVADTGTLDLNNSTLNGGTLNVDGGGTVSIDSNSVIAIEQLDLQTAGIFEHNGGTVETFTISVANGSAYDLNSGRLSFDRFEGDFFQDGGTLAPGRAADLDILTGDYTLNSGGTLEISLDGPSSDPSAYDRLTVGGQLFLAGGSLSVVPGVDFGVSAGDNFLIVDVEGLSSGNFNGLGEGATISLPGGGGDLFITYAGATAATSRSSPGRACPPAALTLTSRSPTSSRTAWARGRPRRSPTPTRSSSKAWKSCRGRRSSWACLKNSS